MTAAVHPALEVPVNDATASSVAPFGVFIDGSVTNSINIPYYTGRVIEGGDIGFGYRGRACVRTAQVLPGDPTVLWLERHIYLTQLFIALGQAPYVMVLAPPNHMNGGDLPDLEQVSALRFPGGSGLLLHSGTWHDFPLACDQPVAFIIANSVEVIEALVNSGGPQEIDEGDVRKVNLADRFGMNVRPLL